MANQVQITNKPRPKNILVNASSPTWAGVQYPLGESGAIDIVVDELAINSGLYQLILTEPGERLMEPEYGVGLMQLIHEPQDDIMYHEVASRIGAAISRWENRIVVMDGINVGPFMLNNGEPMDHSVMVSFTWAFKEDLSQVFLFEEGPVTRASTVNG
jgi:hypothetical protein